MSPERKVPREFLQIEATAHNTKSLDESMAQILPRINSDNLHVLDQLTTGSIHYASFATTRNINTRNQTIKVAALKAGNNNEDVAFSEHGSLHHTFSEAIETIISSVDNQLQLQVSPSPIIIQTNAQMGDSLAKVNRFTVDSTPFSRESYRPFPLMVAENILQMPQSRTPKGLLKLVRKETKSHGIAFGILLCTYLNMSIDQTRDLFCDKNFRRDLISTFGKNTLIPHTSRSQDVALLNQLRNTLLLETETDSHINRDPQAFTNALNTLGGFEYLKKQGQNHPSLQFQPHQETVFARMVLEGASTFAHLIASEELHEPVRSTHINRQYGEIASTKVITAFIYHQ